MKWFNVSIMMQMDFINKLKRTLSLDTLLTIGFSYHNFLITKKKISFSC